MDNVELELAIEMILDSVESIYDTEIVKLENAKGRVIGEDIYAPINQPPFNRSPLDGYAIKSWDTRGASKNSPVKLKVVDEVFAGEDINTILRNNEAIRIMTGAEIPVGADCVIRQEDTDYGVKDVEIYSELKEYENFCFKGEDIKEGTKLISQGQKLTYIHLSVLAMMGITEVSVKRKLKVAVISTGDELTYGGEILEKGKIFDSNRVTISSRLDDFNCDVVVSKIVGDDVNNVSREIDSIINEVDLVVTTGGVSVGKKDIMHDVIRELNAERVFWRVKIKPGTPLLYSVYKNKPILSLSGNPFAALVTFELIGKQLISKMSSDDDLKEKRKKVVMEDDFIKSSPTRRIVRAKYINNKVYLPEKQHSSGAMSSMISCNCLIDIKAGTNQVLKGEEVDIILI